MNQMRQILGRKIKQMFQSIQNGSVNYIHMVAELEATRRVHDYWVDIAYISALLVKAH